jgi:hypothetical protein
MSRTTARSLSSEISRARSKHSCARRRYSSALARVTAIPSSYQPDEARAVPNTYQQGLLTLQRKRTGGNQQVTVKHIHQQVNVTQGGQAVVAGDKVMSGTRGRRGSDGSSGGGMVKNER